MMHYFWRSYSQNLRINIRHTEKHVQYIPHEKRRNFTPHYNKPPHLCVLPKIHKPDVTITLITNSQELVKCGVAGLHRVPPQGAYNASQIWVVQVKSNTQGGPKLSLRGLGLAIANSVGTSCWKQLILYTRKATENYLVYDISPRHHNGWES